MIRKSMGDRVDLSGIITKDFKLKQENNLIDLEMPQNINWF